MSLASRTRFGPYEILAQVGAGGMGEVYRARDIRLNREVALKVLLSDVAGDPARRERFGLEARAVAALNHPNIVAIYDVGEENGIAYIVSELVDGKSLRGVKLGLSKTLDIVSQIAAGLACAHEAGIVHRDLKPENILLSRDGRAKIVDFGLAKATRTPNAGDTGNLAPLTEPGVVMGTATYMSPEQIRGVPADHRADIFSLGVIFHELLSGVRAFQRDSAVESMTAILREDPPELPETVPAGVRRIVAHCLEKEPSDRFQSAKDIVFALSQVATTDSGANPSLPAKRPRRSLFAVGALGLAALGLAALGLGGGYLLHLGSAAPQVWSATRLGGPEVSMTPRISPDGRTLAFEALVDRQTEVAVMRPEAGDWSVLTHHSERGSVTTVSWSPDGNEIYFDRLLDVPHGIYRIPVLGGEEQLVLENAMNPEALPDGSLIVGRLNAQNQVQLYHFWPSTGRQDPLPMQISLSLYVSQVRASPDGREAIVFGSPISEGLDTADMYVVDLASGHSRRAAAGRNPDRAQGVSRDGQSVLFAERRPHQILSVPRKGGAPQVLFPLTNMTYAVDTAQDGSLYLDQVQRATSLVRFSPQGGHAEQLASLPEHDSEPRFAVLPDGRMVWQEQTAERRRLTIVEQGKPTVPFSAIAEETLLPAAATGPTEVALMLGKDRKTIGIASLATGEIIHRIAFDKGEIRGIVATPDGQTLYCNAAGSIWAQPVEEGSPARLVRPGYAVGMHPAGKYLAVIDEDEGRIRLLTVPLDGTPEHEVPISGDATPDIIEMGAVNKDGKLLIGLQSPDSWFLEPAVIDLATGRATRIPIDVRGDSFTMAWAPDGQILAAVTGLESSLWKFQLSGH